VPRVAGIVRSPQGGTAVDDYLRSSNPNVYAAGDAGLTERACHERGIDIRVRRHPFRDVGKALVCDQAEGFLKMLTREDRIRGVAVVGNDAIDIIGEAIALIDRGATARDAADMPHLHPTMSEIFGRVADDFATA